MISAGGRGLGILTRQRYSVKRLEKTLYWKTGANKYVFGTLHVLCITPRDSYKNMGSGVLHLWLQKRSGEPNRGVSPDLVCGESRKCNKMQVQVIVLEELTITPEDVSASVAQRGYFC